MAEIASLSPNALMRLMGITKAPVIRDVCSAKDIPAAPFLKPTARHHHYRQIAALTPDLMGEV